MNNSDKNTKKLFSILISAALFLVIVVFCVIFRLSQKKPVTVEQETSSQTTAESSVLETQFAAASVQTELTDFLSEPDFPKPETSSESETTIFSAQITETLPSVTEMITVETETCPVPTEFISIETETCLETEIFTSIYWESTAPEVSSETTTTETSSGIYYEISLFRRRKFRIFV